MKSAATEAWSRFEKHDIRAYSKDRDGDMYVDRRGGPWIWWYDFMEFIESNQNEEEHF